MFEEVEKNLDSNLRPVVEAIRSDIETLWTTERDLWIRIADEAARESKSIAVSTGILAVTALAGIILGVIGAGLYIHDLYPAVSAGGLILIAACVLGLTALTACLALQKQTKSLLSIWRQTIRLH